MFIFRRPYRFFLIAAALALAMCLLPVRSATPGDAPPPRTAQHTPEASGVPAAIDLSERTQSGCMLHLTLHYAPCGHSVQRREPLSAELTGLTRAALEGEMAKAMPDTKLTGFSAGEIDASRSLPIPCPLHWVLRTGEDGMLHILHNTTGEALCTVRSTDIPASRLPADEQQELLDGRIFDDVQTLEGLLESMSS